MKKTILFFSIVSIFTMGTPLFAIGTDIRGEIVRFDEYYTSQNQLFEIVKLILLELPKDSFVSIENIIKFCRYRELEFHLESSWKTQEYYKECDIVLDSGTTITDKLYLKRYYDQKLLNHRSLCLMYNISLEEVLLIILKLKK